MRNRTLRKVADARPGFTLIELLVSMALTLFLMTILVEAFSSAMDTFSGLRSLGEMQDNLRTSLHFMKDDLSCDHFEGARKMSDANFWTEPRREGFFYFQGTVGAVEVTAAVDPDGIGSRRDVNHVLHFAARRRGNRLENVFSLQGATITGVRTNGPNAPADSTHSRDNNGLASPWAEIAYFLAPMTDPSDPNAGQLSTPDTAGAVKRYNLYRAQLLVMPFTDAMVAANITPATIRTKMSETAAGTYLNPNDLARGPYPLHRSFNPSPSNNAQVATNVARSTLLCSNVLSFSVKFAPPATATGGGYSVPAFQNFAAPFDTANPAATANTQRIKCLQIQLRIYDPSSGLSRQATLLQDM